MSESLRDQLLKSGLGQKLRAEAKPTPAKQNQRSGKPSPAGKRPASPAAPQVARNAAQELNLAHAYALRAKQEKDERELAQRDAERAAQEKRERKQKLANLLSGKSLNANDADVPRHFPHGNKIRRVYCTPDQLTKLNCGDLAVVQLAGRYLLVERDIAVRAQAIDSQALVLLCDPNSLSDDDVPADLMW